MTRQAESSDTEQKGSGIAGLESAVASESAAPDMIGFRNRAPVLPRRLLRTSDVAELLLLPIFGLLSWVVPERFSAGFAVGISRYIGFIRPDRGRSSKAEIEAVVGARPLSIAAADLPDARSASAYGERLQHLRAYRPGGWVPVVRLRGGEHIAHALQGDRGVILWVTDCYYGSVLVKAALAQAGYQLVQLSRPDHGYSETRLGCAVLNPILHRVEDRYLAERLIVDDGRTAATLIAIRGRLSGNGIVAITVSKLGSPLCTAPFLDAELGVAPGAMTIALLTDAPLLPVFLRIDRHDGTFEVHVDAPLEVDKALDRKRAIGRLLSQYIARLEPYVLEYPQLWKGWINLVVSRKAETKPDK